LQRCCHLLLLWLMQIPVRVLLQLQQQARQ
jgi:hypothetical protein